MFDVVFVVPWLDVNAAAFFHLHLHFSDTAPQLVFIHGCRHQTCLLSV